MKRPCMLSPVICIALVLLLRSCYNSGKKKENSELRQVSIQIFDDSKLDNEVIPQIIQSVIDSININNKVFYVLDTLRDYGNYYGINVDSIDLKAKSSAKLNHIKDTLIRNIELRYVSSTKEYTDLTYQDKGKNFILFFSRVHFDKDYNTCVLTVGISAQINTGVTYSIYAQKKSERWVLKRMPLSAIR